jgi:hypothetical protein
VIDEILLQPEPGGLAGASATPALKVEQIASTAPNELDYLIQNTGSGVLHYTVLPDSSLVRVSTISGTLLPGGTQSLRIVSAPRVSTSARTYTAHVTIQGQPGTARSPNPHQLPAAGIHGGTRLAAGDLADILGVDKNKDMYYTVCARRLDKELDRLRLLRRAGRRAQDADVQIEALRPGGPGGAAGRPRSPAE